jgi:hypothetical protein
MWEQGKEREGKDAAGQKPTPGDQLCRLSKQATDHGNLNRASNGRQPSQDCRTVVNRKCKCSPGFVVVIGRVG